MLGQGGMGAVFLAEQRGLGREVAVKLHPPDASPEALKRFLREAEVLASIRHPHVVEIFDVGTLPEGGTYLVMEHLEGPDLDQGLPPGLDPLRVVLPLAGALEEIHRAGILHRDLKPSNVVLAAGERPVLLDFGLAHVVDATAITRAGASVGTLQYMAPEALRGEPATRAADWYGLGGILHYLLEGRPPHGQGDILAFFRRQRPLHPRLERRARDDRLGNLARALLDPSPERRPASRRDCERALVRGPGGSSTQATQLEALALTDQVARPQRRRGLAALAALGLLSLALLSWRSPSPPPAPPAPSAPLPPDLEALVPLAPDAAGHPRFRDPRHEGILVLRRAAPDEPLLVSETPVSWGARARYLHATRRPGAAPPAGADPRAPADPLEPGFLAWAGAEALDPAPGLPLRQTLGAPETEPGQRLLRRLPPDQARVLAARHPEAPPPGFQALGPNSTGHREFFEPRSGATWILVPGGPFPSRFGPGAEPGQNDVEVPERPVELPAFLLDATPVTTRRLARYLEATGAEPPMFWPQQRERPDRPVTGVSWGQAQAYASWCRARLVHSQEWERAARGLDGRENPWGDTPATEAHGVFGSEDLSFLGAGMMSGGEGLAAADCCPAGRSAVGAWGMIGNVFTWTRDRRPRPGGGEPWPAIVGSSFLVADRTLIPPRTWTPDGPGPHLGIRLSRGVPEGLAVLEDPPPLEPALGLRTLGRNAAGYLELENLRDGGTLVYHPGALEEGERPAHAPFLIDRAEVSVARYARFLDATGRPPPPAWSRQLEHPERAVAGVSGLDARDYCAWAGGRAISRQEFALASRGRTVVLPDADEGGQGLDPSRRREANPSLGPLMLAVATTVGAEVRAEQPDEASVLAGVHGLLGSLSEWTREKASDREEPSFFLVGSNHSRPGAETVWNTSWSASLGSVVTGIRLAREVSPELSRRLDLEARRHRARSRSELGTRARGAGSG